jgi:hypothetical protein
MAYSRSCDSRWITVASNHWFVIDCCNVFISIIQILFIIEEKPCWKMSKHIRMLTSEFKETRHALIETRTSHAWKFKQTAQHPKQSAEMTSMSLCKRNSHKEHVCRPQLHTSIKRWIHYHKTTTCNLPTPKANCKIVYCVWSYEKYVEQAHIDIKHHNFCEWRNEGSMIASCQHQTDCNMHRWKMLE